ncbi:hypothetical protein L596_030785 [Steinernema carpocapsae]|uniref:Chondroitin proteoglycan 4 domain-containing protein n=1 Tax=Steinernema carpocapsae TaxID=34508 RepID=A0A4V5ZX44_STECR|nr:hypothetical protein L596_030785 [Steinernema carpocapsae]
MINGTERAIAQARDRTREKNRSCRGKCTQVVKPADLSFNVYTIANYVKFFEGLEQKCARVKQARDCIDLCEDDGRENPYASKAWRIACMESNIDTINSITPCLQDESNKVKQVCQKECGPANAFNEEESEEEKHTQRSRLRMVRLTSSKCSYVKCFLQCSRKEYSKLCPKVNEGRTEVGDFVGTFYERLLQASRDEMSPISAVTDFIQRIRINECSFLRNPTEVFDPPTMGGKTGYRVRGLFDSTMDSVQAFLDGFFREFPTQ